MSRSRRYALALPATLAVLALGVVPSLLPQEREARAAERVVHGAGLATIGAPASGSVGPDSPGSFTATLPNGRRVTPAGTSVQVGQNPLNSILTPDGKYLITTNDDERNAPPRTGTSVDPADTKNGADVAQSQFTLGVVDTATMHMAASIPVPKRLAPPNPGSTFNGRTDTDATNGLFLGLAAVATPNGYTLYAAGGVADVLYKYGLDATGTPYVASPEAPNPVQIPMPVPQDRTRASYGMAAPGWLTVSDDAKTLYVVNNNGNSVTPVDLYTGTPGTPVPVGYFPYAAQQYGSKLFVSNWGVMDRPFTDGAGTVDPVTGNVVHTGTQHIGGLPDANLFANPPTSAAKSSSLSVLDLTGGAPKSVSLARPIDGVHIVGGTHPSALATVRNSGGHALYVADANEDRIAVVDPDTERLVRKIALPPPANLSMTGAGDPGERPVFGLYPNALAVSPDGRTMYVAEAMLNSVAVYDVSTPLTPHFRGRIPTGWYPTGVTVSKDGTSLYVTNAKGAGSPYGYQGTYVAPGTYTNPDVNWLFGSVQKVNLGSLDLSSTTRNVTANTIVRSRPSPTRARTLTALQQNIKHVVYILRENKTYDTYFGDDPVLNSRGANGGGPGFAPYGPYVPNTRALAQQFNVGDNFYADAEESNAGHSFALSGTSTDFQQKTLLSRGTRPLVNLKNEDPEDYPLQGYIFNAMARAGRSFRDYGDMIRISGYDEGAAPDFCADDPKPGCDNTTYNNIQDTTSPTAGLGGQYSERVAALKVLKGHLDENYPGWDLRISDQRRAKEFIRDYGARVKAGTAPQFTFLWLPGDHTGTCTTGTVTCTPTQEVADNDAALGQVVDFLSHAKTWGKTAVFVTEDDAQSAPDHVSAHRTYVSVYSPYAKHATVVHSLASTVSIPKTIEEILDLPAMTYGDLLGNDLISFFNPTPAMTAFTAVPASRPGPVPAETQRIWELTAHLDNSTYDADTGPVGRLSTLWFRSLALARHHDGMSRAAYDRAQDAIYRQAREAVSG